MNKLILCFLLLAPPSIREIMYYYTAAVPYTNGTWVHFETHEESVKSLFEFMHKQIFILGLKPNFIMFDVKPYDSNEYLKMYDMAGELLKAL